MVALISGPGAWGLLQANFSNPVYISGDVANTPLPGASAGFTIDTGDGLAISFEGTYTGLTVAHEQTLDPSGAAGWFSVAGQVTSSVGATAPVTDGSTSGSCYVFPTFGVRHRIKVTAMSTGTVTVRVATLGFVPSLLATKV